MALTRKLWEATIVSSVGLASLVGCGSEQDNSGIEWIETTSGRKTTINNTGYAILEKAHIPRHVADGYNLRFVKWGVNPIKELHKNGIEPAVANGYATRFIYDAVINLQKAGIPSHIANRFDEKFSPKSIIELHEERITAKEANKYLSERVQPEMVVELAKRGITPEMRRAYHSFSPADILILRGVGVPPEVAKEYQSSFHKATDIRSLHVQKISPEEAARFGKLNLIYGARITPDDILWYRNQRIPFEKVEERAKLHGIDESIRDKQ